MMQAVASFAMASRGRAILVAVLCALGALLVPPFTSPLSYLGAAVVALVSLRLGAWEGLAVLGAGVFALGLLGAILGGMALPLTLAVLPLWLPLWGCALLLRHSRSLATTLKAVALVGVALVIGIHLGLGNPAEWWEPRIEALLEPAFAQQGLDAAPYVSGLARWMTALIGAALVLSLVLSLLLGRAWQAALYNPGGFGAEFRSLELGQGFALLGLAMLALASLDLGRGSVILADAVPTLLVLYGLQGLALAHAVIRHKQLQRGWLVGLYLILGFVPQALVLIAVLGWMESWFNLRSRLSGRG